MPKVHVHDPRWKVGAEQPEWAKEMRLGYEQEVARNASRYELGHRTPPFVPYFWERIHRLLARGNGTKENPYLYVVDTEAKTVFPELKGKTDVRLWQDTRTNKIGLAGLVAAPKSKDEDVAKGVAKALDEMLDSMKNADRSGFHVPSEPRINAKENRVEVTFRVTGAPYEGTFKGTEEEYTWAKRNFEDRTVTDTKRRAEAYLNHLREHVSHIGVSYGDKDYIDIWVTLK